MNYKEFLKGFLRIFFIEEQILQLQRKIERLQLEVKELKKPKEPQLIFTTVLFNNQIKILSIMELKVKEFIDTVLALEDTDTKAVINATFANITLASSDPSIFTVDSDANADGTLDIVGVAEGTADLTVTADASYTDGNTNEPVTASKTATISITVSKPLPGAENTDLVISFTPATATT